MTSPLVVQVAPPHPAAVCLLPATSPDDGATLGTLPDADALFERLSFKGCFAREDGCDCLKRHGLCDEMRGLLDLPAGTPGLDDACGVSCAKPLTTSGASCHASAAPSRHHPPLRSYWVSSQVPVALLKPLVHPQSAAALAPAL
jgi:hypothetical protein